MLKFIRSKGTSAYLHGLAKAPSGKTIHQSPALALRNQLSLRRIFHLKQSHRDIPQRGR